MKTLAAIMFAVLMLSGVAYATPITLTDTTNFTASGTDSPEDLVGYKGDFVNKLEGPLDYVAWKHQFVYVPPVGEILSGVLKLYLRDDGDLMHEFAFGYGESGQWGFGEVDTGMYKYNLNVSYLYDGEFDVTLGSLYGDFYIDKSELYIKYTPAPVPEPATLLLLGSGLLGMGFYGRRRMKRGKI